ncbi:MAG: serine/threonine protein kinase [Planctomycetes bacterium]|nr:serine/threonine protein kinase [Planctomycetota bacterium]
MKRPDDERRLAEALRGAFLDEVGLREGAAGGRSIGPYLLLAPLGRGASGTVWRALHRELLHEVALKLLELRGDPDASAEPLERFRREAATAARLRHPGIVTVHDFGHEGTSWYLVMDLVDGLPLDRWIEQERPDLARRLAVVEQVARAADHAHRHGVIHRDLKPSNVMVRRGDEAVLVDFGVARDRADRSLTAAGGVVGTYAFMAPEQLDGSREPDARSDLFSLGVLLQFALTGRPAFGHAATPADALALRATTRPAPTALDPTLPRALDSLVARCLEPAPDRRLADAGALADELARLRGANGGASSSANGGVLAPRGGRGRRLAIGGGLVALLLALSQGVHHFLDQRRELDAHAEALAIESALLELSPQLRRLFARAETARYRPLAEAERGALRDEIDAILAASGDTTGVAAAYSAWCDFLLDPTHAADSFARAKLRHPGNPVVWLLSARRHLRRAADSPAWSTSLPISYELLVEPLAAPATLHSHPSMRLVLSDARDDLEQARRTAQLDALPGLEWITRLVEGLESFERGDPRGVIERLERIAAHDDIDFEATLFLCLALFDQRRVPEALHHARALHQMHPGVVPATKLLALCLQVDARDRLDLGQSPVEQLEEARRCFAAADSGSLVDAILAAQLDFDLECAHLYAGTASEAGWRACVAQWSALRDRIVVQEGIADDARGAAHARVGWARSNLALAVLNGQPALDEQERAAADYGAAVALAGDHAWVRVQELQARLLLLELRVRLGEPLPEEEAAALATRIAQLRERARPSGGANGGANGENPWTVAQAELGEVQLAICAAVAAPVRDAALAQRCKAAAAQARRVRALAPQIATTTVYEIEAELWARVAEPGPLGELGTLLQRVSFAGMTQEATRVRRWFEPLFALARDPRCGDRGALLDLAAATAERVAASGLPGVGAALAVEVALRRRWLEPDHALTHVATALERAAAARAHDAADRDAAEAEAFALLALAELGGDATLDYDACLEQAAAALVVARTPAPSARGRLLRARLAQEQGDAAALAAARAELHAALASDLAARHAARSWLAAIDPRPDRPDDLALAALWHALLD